MKTATMSLLLGVLGLAAPSTHSPTQAPSAQSSSTRPNAPSRNFDLAAPATKPAPYVDGCVIRKCVCIGSDCNSLKFKAKCAKGTFEDTWYGGTCYSKK